MATPCRNQGAETRRPQTQTSRRKSQRWKTVIFASLGVPQSSGRTSIKICSALATTSSQYMLPLYVCVYIYIYIYIYTYRETVLHVIYCVCLYNGTVLDYILYQEGPMRPRCANQTHKNRRTLPRRGMVAHAHASTRYSIV